MIYVLAEDSDRSVVKIGTTATGPVVSAKAALSRLSGCQTGTWRKLILVAVCAGDASVEQWLHRRFRDQWVRGEWFRNEGPVSEWLASVAAMEPISGPEQRRPSPSREMEMTRRIASQDARIKEQGARIADLKARLDDTAAERDLARTRRDRITKLERALSDALSAKEAALQDAAAARRESKSAVNAARTIERLEAANASLQARLDAARDRIAERSSRPGRAVRELDEMVAASRRIRERNASPERRSRVIRLIDQDHPFNVAARGLLTGVK